MEQRYLALGVRETALGYVHIDGARFRSAEGKTRMDLAMDRTSKVIHVEVSAAAGMSTGGACMRNVIKAAPRPRIAAALP